MGSNSIYEALNTDSIINEIRLTLSATPNTPFVIVEGNDDISFFKHHCPEGVRIRESFKGKVGVYQILENFSNKKSVIGICDRDYDHAPLPTNIFAYDFSCLEAMLFANTKTKEIVFTQLNLKNNISLEEILNQLCWLSHLRKKSFQESLAINFDGLKISKLFDCTCGLKTDKLIIKLNEINDTSLLLSNEQIESIESIVNLVHTFDDLLNITQGHDLLSLIQCYHAHHVPSKGRTMGVGDIRAMLYCTYVEKFNTSKIYNDVLIYGQSVNIIFWAA